MAVQYDIIRHIGVIGEGSRGWKKEINIISWNNRAPKIDIRDWDENHEKMGKGVTLSKEEASSLKNILSELDIQEIDM